MIVIPAYLVVFLCKVYTWFPAECDGMFAPTNPRFAITRTMTILWCVMTWWPPHTGQAKLGSREQARTSLSASICIFDPFAQDAYGSWIVVLSRLQDPYECGKLGHFSVKLVQHTAYRDLVVLKLPQSSFRCHLGLAKGYQILHMLADSDVLIVHWNGYPILLVHYGAVNTNHRTGHSEFIASRG